MEIDTMNKIINVSGLKPEQIGQIQAIIEAFEAKNKLDNLAASQPNTQTQDIIVSPSKEESIIETFQALASQWYDETGGSSFIVEKTSHPAYKKIIALGQPVVPLLLRELEKKPTHWFHALRTITGANPIEPEQRGRMKQMAESWLKWGRKHGYKW